MLENGKYFLSSVPTVEPAGPPPIITISKRFMHAPVHQIAISMHRERSKSSAAPCCWQFDARPQPRVTICQNRRFDCYRNLRFTAIVLVRRRPGHGRRDLLRYGTLLPRRSFTDDDHRFPGSRLRGEHAEAALAQCAE